MLTKLKDVEEACRKITKDSNKFGADAAEIKCYALYSTLPPSQQQKIFESAPPPRFFSQAYNGPPGRKVIISTSILLQTICFCSCNLMKLETLLKHH